MKMNKTKKSLKRNYKSILYQKRQFIEKDDQKMQSLPLNADVEVESLKS